MADVKESALTQQSDCKWVRALDANGNSIRISKEDLASVVGGLLGNPLGFTRVLTAEDDCNNLKDGIYSHAYPNEPLNAYNRNCTLIQISTHGRNDRWQFAMSLNDKGIAFRIKAPEGWTGWSKFASIIA